MADVRFGSVPVAEYTLRERLVPGVKQPFDQTKISDFEGRLTARTGRS